MYVIVYNKTGFIYSFSSQVKKSLAQVVIAMASHGYLLLEGGESLIEFIIRGSALNCEEDDPKSPKKVCGVFNIFFVFTK